MKTLERNALKNLMGGTDEMLAADSETCTVNCGDGSTKSVICQSSCSSKEGTETTRAWVECNEVKHYC
jgi:hypothetical protein